MNFWMIIALAFYVLGTAQAFVAITQLDDSPDAKEWVAISLWPLAVVALAVFVVVLAVCEYHDNRKWSR
jgi:uncharacterized membrane protein YhaH (DUF805 family)